MLYSRKPDGFISDNSISLCICSYQGKILILRRTEEDDGQTGKWSFPGGRVEEGESETEALLREVAEETGFYLEKLH